jgi:AbrB family looped-hinge helix DNA binding protein
MSSAKLSAKGWIVIPAELRRKYNLKGGGHVQIVDYGGALTIVPSLADPIAEARGMLKDDVSLTSTLLKSKAEDRERE